MSHEHRQNPERYYDDEGEAYEGEPHWRCGLAPEPKPLSQPCPVHDAERPCVLAECVCGEAVGCHFCDAIAYKHEPFGGNPTCLDCFDQLISA